MASKRNKNLWFPFFWNDYTNDTLTLDMLQHGAYLKCLLACYKSNGPLPSDLPSVFRMVGAFTPDEQKAVTFVLQTFFQKSDSGSYSHKRVTIELQRIEEKRAMAADLARRRWKNGKAPDANADAMAESEADAKADAKAYANRAEQTDRLSKAPESENSENGQSVRKSDDCVSGDFLSSKSTAIKLDAPTRAERWTKFVMNVDIDLPDEMKHAMPTDEERDKVLAQLDEIGAEKLSLAIGDWVEMQSPPISGVWRMLYGALHKRRTLTRADSAAAVLLVEQWILWETVNREAQERPFSVLTWTDGSGNEHSKTVESAALKAAATLHRTIMQGLQQFSATPASREKTKKTKEPALKPGKAQTEVERLDAEIAALEQQEANAEPAVEDDLLSGTDISDPPRTEAEELMRAADEALAEENL